MATQTRRGLMAIGVMKLFKGLALLIAGVGVLSLLHRDAAETVRHWIEYIRIDPHDRLIDHFLEKVAGVNHRTLRRLGLGSIVYSAVFCTEGVGLLLAKHWAEYMTAGVTASFLPIEVYEFVSHPSIVRGLVTLLNVVVVAYLIFEIRKERAERKASTGEPQRTPPPRRKVPELPAKLTPNSRAAREP